MITELDDKYIVVKREDIHKYLKGNSRYHTEDGFYSYLNVINIHRNQAGKRDNCYVVLNLDDEISIDYLIEKLKRFYIDSGKFAGEYEEPRVKRIAVDLVNAILKSKGD